MSKINSFLLATALCTTLGTPLVAEDVTGNTVVATVGGTEITVGHMIAMTANLPAEQRQLPIEVIFEGVLERLIQQEAISQTQSDPSYMTQLQLENERRSLIASEIVNGIAEAIEVTPEAVQAAYDRRFDNFTPSMEYNASHILVETEDEAKALITDLEGGADFAELAKTKSTGPSGPNGGELGWFGLGRMVPEFETAVVAMEKDGISAPVQTQFGWHVIKLNDTRQPEAPTLEEMQGDLEQEVWREALQAKISTMVDAASVERADVTGIDPNVLADVTLLEK
ncbi:MAG: peptidylprolyl isomerase [Rhodobacter sp.]|nr:peptidylprolyl isomerase [Rhodobacter sp.]